MEFNLIYDVGVIGLGVAGALATLKLSSEKITIVGFDIGRPPMKRRRQLEGWLGCWPNSDGKLYQTDIGKVGDIVGLRTAKKANKEFNELIGQVNNFKVIKDKSPNANIKKKLNKLGYNISLNDYIQMIPKDIHALSKYIANKVENDNINLIFDDEILSISKSKGIFTLLTENKEYKCKKLIIAAGRAGWRWVNKIYKDFGIIESNDIAKFGIRVEVNSNIMKDFNKSNCTISNKQMEIGPLSWYGTIIPEDHLDTAIAAFRSNENRWKTDKVSFSLIGNIDCPNNGFEQTDRLAKLTFILTNDRISKEKVSTFLNGRSKISIMPEYNWLHGAIKELSGVIDELQNKAYFHVPEIYTNSSNINIGSNLETEIPNMYVVGESANIHGLLSAGITGIVAANSIIKG